MPSGTSACSFDAHHEVGDDPAHHLFAIVLDRARDRNAFRSRLADRGVQTSVHYPPIHLFSVYRSDTSLPLTETYAERTVTLPLFPEMSARQLETVVGTVREALA
jgi:dTDP-4-amino-4,6-dideoxygalactose transaminase